LALSLPPIAAVRPRGDDDGQYASIERPSEGIRDAEIPHVAGVDTNLAWLWINLFVVLKLLEPFTIIPRSLSPDIRDHDQKGCPEGQQQRAS